jgi:hypothetical protein
MNNNHQYSTDDAGAMDEGGDAMVSMVSMDFHKDSIDVHHTKDTRHHHHHHRYRHDS